MEQQKTRILIIAANPWDTKRLELDEEYREIKEILQASKHRDDFELEYAPAANDDDLRRQLLNFDPHIVHFSGHGELQGLYFRNDAGNAQLIRKEALERLFALFKDKINCIVLNACYSEEQAQAFAKHIERVIGMNNPIGDEAAVQFAKGFYEALFSGKNVDFAFQIGTSAIEIANLEDWQVPQLKKRGENLAQSLPTAQPYLAHYSDDVVIHAAAADVSFAESFKIELQKHLAAKLGGLDKFRLRLQTNQDEFAQAATVIILLSEQYLQQYGEHFQNSLQLKEKRLLLVEIHKTVKPGSLAEVVEYPFWQQVRQNVFTYQATDSSYQLLMADLVVELEGLLQQLKTQQPFQEADPANKIAVFINVAPEDRALAKQVQMELAQKYHLVSALPATTETRTDIENKYRYCQAVLFIYVNGSEEWVDNQLLACEQAANEHHKQFKIVAIHTNEQQFDHINVMLPYLKPPYYCPPHNIQDYLAQFVEALQ